MSDTTTVVDIPDANLNIALHGALDIPLRTPLTDDDLSKLTVLNAAERGISDLTGINYCVNLVKADLSLNPIKTLEPLTPLAKLAWLSIQGCNAASGALDMTPLQSLAALRYLNVAEDYLSTIDPIPQLVNLESLILDGNALVPDEMKKLVFPNLIHLDVADGQFTDLSFVSGMPKLRHLGVPYCYRVSDISALTTLPDLRELNMGYMTLVSDFSPLAKMTSLRSLNVQNCRIADKSLLGGLTNLEILNINEIRAFNLEFVSGLVNLRELYLQQNHVRDLSPLANLAKLAILGVVKNEVSDLTPLAGLQTLIDIDAEANAITTLAGMENCPLQSLNVSNNYLTDMAEITQLTAKGVSLAYFGNFLLGVPSQHALAGVKPVSMEVGGTTQRMIEVLSTSDGKTYGRPSDQQNPSAFGYTQTECEDKSVARAVLRKVDVSTWTMLYDINGLSAGDTVISVHYRPSESIDVLLPFTDGTTSCAVHVG
ncbi:leucine-rich repeat domain-containing protein [Paraburkholderia humisilvae]|uniref:Internalin-A n=1 Tax=Paraburkholderia humisilvae TaxID=627669 RepID=A0A6J5EN78_9BURK|nr:hypothetical protein [Paraburkholderia humisilvae]CAB3767633.1 hypothetical protein LMG29542_05663 [Paraburkholderia humisilvae]